MYAVWADKIDFWGEFVKRKPGSQVGRGRIDTKIETRDGLSIARISQELDWVSADKKPVLRERRTIDLYCAKDLGATLLSWSTRLSPAEGRPSVRVTGSHYAGLGMRFIVPMDKGGTFLNPTGKAGEVVRGTERLVAAEWCAYTAAVDGKTVTVAMFDHPANFRGALWFTMTRPFAYLSATLNLHRKPVALEKGGKLEVVYGVAVWDGKVDKEKIAVLYKKWLALETKKTIGKSAKNGE
jgi:hypothetical protein